jgi:hypothetical protein
MSRPRIAVLRLAARRCVRQLLGAGAAAIVAGERWSPAAGDAGMPQGRFRGLRSRGAGAKMAFVLPIRSRMSRPHIAAPYLAASRFDVQSTSAQVIVRERRKYKIPIRGQTGRFFGSDGWFLPPREVSRRVCPGCGFRVGARQNVL